MAGAIDDARKIKDAIEHDNVELVRRLLNHTNCELMERHRSALPEKRPGAPEPHGRVRIQPRPGRPMDAERPSHGAQAARIAGRPSARPAAPVWLLTSEVVCRTQAGRRRVALVLGVPARARSVRAAAHYASC